VEPLALGGWAGRGRALLTWGKGLEFRFPSAVHSFQVSNLALQQRNKYTVYILYINSQVLEADTFPLGELEQDPMRHIANETVVYRTEPNIGPL
jgi:hypothetical protein